MNAIDLAGVGPGFADPVFESQAAFRGCLDALATPGTVVSLGAGLESLPGLHAAASALLLALLDQDTRLWLSPRRGGGPDRDEPEVPHRLLVRGLAGRSGFRARRRRRGTAAAGRLQRRLRRVPGALGDASCCRCRRSSTAGWRLSGPGHPRRGAAVACRRSATRSSPQWERNRARFPRGVDLYVRSGDRLCGLPRTTRIDAAERGRRG